MEPALESNQIQLDHGRLRYWRGGAGPVLLLVHGAWGDAQAHWGGVWDALAQRFTVVAPDLPGWGLSETHARASCSDLAADLAAMLKLEGISKCAVVGNSFGASIAWQLGADRPDLIERVVLVNGGPVPTLPRWVKRVCGLEPVMSMMLGCFRRMSFKQAAVERALVDLTAFPAGFVEAAVALGPRAAEVGFDAVRFQPAGPSAPAAPVTLIWGDKDTLVRRVRARKMSARLSARLRIMPGAGHLPQVQCPGLFIEELTRPL